MVTQEQIEEVKNRLVANYQPNKIILFGSYARGDANEDSDLDIIVVKSGIENEDLLKRYSDAIIAIRGTRSAQGGTAHQ